MTLTIAVNANNDMYLTPDGNIAIVYDLEATLQACAQAAKTILGEMIYATNLGIPYFETVFSGVLNIPQFAAALRSAWLAIPDVVEVITLDIAQAANTLTYTATIMTDYGQGVVNG
jgi:hypothetical protein